MSIGGHHRKRVVQTKLEGNKSETKIKENNSIYNQQSIEY